MYECKEKIKADNCSYWYSSIFFIHIVSISLIQFYPDKMKHKTDEDDKQGDHCDDYSVDIGHPTVHDDVQPLNHSHLLPEFEFFNTFTNSSKERCREAKYEKNKVVTLRRLIFNLCYRFFSSKKPNSRALTQRTESLSCFLA